MADAFNIKGIDNVLTLLRRLPKEVASKNGGPVLKNLRKGARVIAVEESLNLARTIGALSDDEAESTGLLLKSIIVSRGKAPIGGNGERVLIRIKRNAYQREGKTVTTLQSAQLKEYGSEKQAAEPFIRPAFNSKASEAVSVVTKGLAADVEKLAAKYLK